MRTVILIFDNYTALDIVGAYEVLARIPDMEIYLAGAKGVKEYCDKYGLKLTADYSLDEISEADILMVPGGPGIDYILENNKVTDWIIKLNKKTNWTISVCSGSLLLARAGLLDGKKCTTHWRRKDQLCKFNVQVMDERYVHEGKIITSAGVSAGIDMALYLTALICGEEMAEMIQLSVEYDPQPPFDSGSVKKASKSLLEKFSRKP